jgi:hypothetical protein
MTKHEFLMETKIMTNLGTCLSTLNLTHLSYDLKATSYNYMYLVINKIRRFFKFQSFLQYYSLINAIFLFFYFMIILQRLLTMRSRVRFTALPQFKMWISSGTMCTQPLQDNWVADLIKKVLLSDKCNIFILFL